ncbi:MAG: glutamine synthetase, partial [Candidatus Limnocylindrales bacterium]
MPDPSKREPSHASSEASTRRGLRPAEAAGQSAADGPSGAERDTDRRAVERVLTVIRDTGVQQVELQFADVTGAIKTVAVPARRIQAVMADGEWFDGSAIEGLAREVESDMYLRPDPTTFSIVEPGGVPCARLICEVV